MSILELIHQPLKGDDLIELLELHDAEVTYYYDRCHENIPDSYSTRISELGLELSFDDAQILRTIFITVADVDVASAFDGEITPFASVTDAIAFAEEQGFPFQQGRSELFGVPTVWIRIEYPDHRAHFEYRPSTLTQITLTGHPAA